MRHPTILVALACALLLAPQTRAAGRTLDATQAALSRVHAGAPEGYATVTDPRQLRIPPAVLTPDPTNYAVVSDRSLGPDEVQQYTIQGQHIHMFALPRDIGMQGAYWEQVGGPLADGGVFYMSYLGTHYASADAADAAFKTLAAGVTLRDGNGTPTGYLVPLTCSGGDGCVEFEFVPLDPATGSPQTYPFGDVQTSVRARIRLLLAGNAIMEGGYFISPTDFNAHRTSGDARTTAMSAAFLAAMADQKPAPTPPSAGAGPADTPLPPLAPPPTLAPPPVLPTLAPPPPLPTATPPPPRPTAPALPRIAFRVLAVQVAPNGTKLGSSPAGASLHQLRAGSRAAVSLYVSISRAPRGADADVSYLIKRGSSTVRQLHHTFHLGTLKGTARYRFTVTNVRFSSPGLYSITVRIQIGNKSEQGNTSITVKS